MLRVLVGVLQLLRILPELDSSVQTWFKASRLVRDKCASGVGPWRSVYDDATMR